jgi:hypothetical protein
LQHPFRKAFAGNPPAFAIIEQRENITDTLLIAYINTIGWDLNTKNFEEIKFFQAATGFYKPGELDLFSEVHRGIGFVSYTTKKMPKISFGEFFNKKMASLLFPQALMLLMIERNGE